MAKKVMALENGILITYFGSLNQFLLKTKIISIEKFQWLDDVYGAYSFSFSIAQDMSQD